MSEAIHFTGIEIRRMPGFPDGGLTVEGFSAGINVVYGPNASGKSTLARAMQRVLRQQAPGRQTDSLKAALVFDSQFYDFDLHLGDRIC
ncbi:MAG: ATP-binding protein, partial [Planctomycetes bacterium]|nr:ATP-binding protein [Planctomycetota bacterium]